MNSLSVPDQPWPWWVAGPLIGLLVPTLLLIGNKPFGVSSSLRAICAAVAPGRVPFFHYDWKRSGAWSIAFVLGVLIGGAVAGVWLGPHAPDISSATISSLTSLGLGPIAGLAPPELFSWPALLTLRGATCVIGGGFLVGFGASWSGGCTSGHGITGLAALQLASLVAIVAVFASGVITTFVLLPWIL